ncbi:hypothetical protein [Sulfuriferula sp. AH1]|uniref:hypothetical protein n=1 Tax=Sulfuriferula sp. AH1 TaxID=1985873 RepID=UPI001671E8DF|nr:hypothetical protein [Sulfuriferula sp. AH1]
MSTSSRVVTIWALTKPGDWVFYITHMLRSVGISDTQWRRVKKELIEHGFFIQEKKRTEEGKIEWVNTFTDEPLFLLTDKTIRTKTTSGKTTRGFETGKDTNNTINKDISSSKAATEKNQSLHGILVKNQQDVDNIKGLVSKFGQEKVELAASQVPPALGQAYPYQTVVYKFLTSKTTNFKGNHNANHQQDFNTYSTESSADYAREVYGLSSEE